MEAEKSASTFFTRPFHPLWRSESQSPQVSIFRDSYLFLPIWLWNEAVPQSHSMCFPRHGGILVGSPNRHSRQVSVMRSSSRPLRAVRTVPEQAVETSQWRGWHEAASCDVRTHDAESVTSVCSEHHCRMACSGAYRIFLAEEDWCCLQDSQVSPLRSHFSWKIPSWNCSAPQLFPRFGWT